MHEEGAGVPDRHVAACMPRGKPGQIFAAQYDRPADHSEATAPPCSTEQSLPCWYGMVENVRD